MYSKYQGCVSDNDSESLGQVIRLIKQLDSRQISLLYELLQGFASPPKHKDSDECVLSPRELEVLTLLANGYTRRNIADSLGISKNTAARHICNIYSKIGVSSVAEATQFAYANHLCLTRAASEDEPLQIATRINGIERSAVQHVGLSV